MNNIDEQIQEVRNEYARKIKAQECTHATYITDIRKDLATEIARLEARREKDVWGITGDGQAFPLKYYDKDNVEQRTALGMTAPTKELAEKKVAQMRAMQRVVAKIAEINGDWKADWSNNAQKKYSLRINHQEAFLFEKVSTYLQTLPANLYGCRKSIEYIRDNMMSDYKTALNWSDKC